MSRGDWLAIGQGWACIPWQTSSEFEAIIARHEWRKHGVTPSQGFRIVVCHSELSWRFLDSGLPCVHIKVDCLTPVSLTLSLDYSSCTQKTPNRATRKPAGELRYRKRDIKQYESLCLRTPHLFPARLMLKCRTWVVWLPCRTRMFPTRQRDRHRRDFFKTWCPWLT